MILAARKGKDKCAAAMWLGKAALSANSRQDTGTYFVKENL